jgi:hypothetical protein
MDYMPDEREERERERERERESKLALPGKIILHVFKYQLKAKS